MNNLKSICYLDKKLNNIDFSKNYDETILYFDYLKLLIEKVKTNLEPTSYTSHLQMINSRIKNYFTLNSVKLLELGPIHIQNFYDISIIILWLDFGYM